MNKIIIMPTYNEAENVKKIVPQIFNLIDISILIVDDNSPDGTASIVENLQKEYKNLHLLKRNSKDGLARAYLDGFKYALNKGFGIFIQIDADFQHPIDVLPKMLKELEKHNADVVVGSRYIQNENWKNANKIKKIISKLGNKYSQIVLRTKIKDITGGYNIWTKNALDKINLSSIISKGYMFQIEMKYKAEKNELKILEYPIIFNQREKGKSKMSFKICLEALINIWKIK